ncbi:MAG: ATP-binding cassette domain-containing protein [Candidatus Krumholzibacteria bacterium]|jgi:ABC-2 type transport system ATP-binding protein|nr:ATP-binding cassette domain-containing protein [Candidatus Krumholzibacteria bacterium]
MIEVNGLRKYFGNVKAVDGLSFGVKEGEIFGFLGPNGAGKTTTISMLSGLLRPDAGTITIAGMEMSGGGGKARSIMGIVPQEIALYEELSGRENLHFWGSLYGLSGARLREETDRVLDMVELSDRADDPVGKYSGGMKRRINLCAGLIHRPQIILLDEPTLGIDPQARIRILDIVRKEAESGTTVIYTTHYLEEAESLCKRIAIIDQGRIHAEGTLAELVKLVGEEDIVTITGDFRADAFPALPEGTRIDRIADGTARLVVRDHGAVGSMLSGFFSSGLRVDTVAISEPNLQGVFLKLTGKELRD